MPTTAADHPVDPEAVAVVDGLGWQVAPDSPAFRSLSAALSAADAAGVGLSPGLLRDYAQAVHGVAEVDLGVRRAHATPEEALRTVVIGTVMLDPVLVALRRVAQEAVSAEAGGGPEPDTASGTPDATKARSWWTGPSARVAPTGFEPALPP